MAVYLTSELQTLKESELTQKFASGRIWQDPTPSKSMYVSMFCFLNQVFIFSIFICKCTYLRPNPDAIKLTDRGPVSICMVLWCRHSIFSYITLLTLSIALWNIILIFRWGSWGLERLNGLLLTKEFIHNRNNTHPDPGLLSFWSILLSPH